MIIRVQTTGKISPNEAITQAFTDLMTELQSIDDQFLVIKKNQIKSDEIKNYLNLQSGVAKAKDTNE